MQKTLRENRQNKNKRFTSYIIIIAFIAIIIAALGFIDLSPSATPASITVPLPELHG